VTCWAVIPIKATGEAKSRLSGVLDPGERQALVAAMLDHVIATAKSARKVSGIFLVGPKRSGFPDDVPLLADPGTGLNPAVQSALAGIADMQEERAYPDRVLFIAADLPKVTPQELDLLALAPPGVVAIAPDRHGTGTNAISLPLPAAREFAFAFGHDSFARHQEEARRLGLDVETVYSPGLEKDVDEPADLPDAKSAVKQER